MGRKRKNFHRTYVRLRWFFERITAEGGARVSLDPNSWLFRKPDRGGSGLSEGQDRISTIRILLQRLWNGPPPCLPPGAGRLSPAEKQHLVAEFFGGALVRREHHGAILNRALAKIDRVFEAAGIYESGVRSPGSGVEKERVDLSEYEKIVKRRENIIRE